MKLIDDIFGHRSHDGSIILEDMLGMKEECDDLKEREDLCSCVKRLEMLITPVFLVGKL